MVLLLRCCGRLNGLRLSTSARSRTSGWRPFSSSGLRSRRSDLLLSSSGATTWFRSTDSSAFVCIRRTFAAEESKMPTEVGTTNRTTAIEDRRSILHQVMEAPADRVPETIGGKVVEQATNLTLYGIAVFGLTVLFGVGYLLWAEFFSTASPNKISRDAVKLINKDEECVNMLGAPIKATGQASSRRGKSGLWDQSFEKDGKRRIRVIFFVRGCNHFYARVQVEMQKNEFGKWKHRYVFVEKMESPFTTVLVVDNRHLE